MGTKQLKLRSGNDMNSSETHPSTHFEAWLERRKIPWLVVVIVLPAIIFFSELPYGLMLSEGGVKRMVLMLRSLLLILWFALLS